MKQDYRTTPLVELFIQMTYLEQSIDMDLLKGNVTKETEAKLIIYEEMRKEVVRRFPPLEKDEVFQPKTLTLKKERKGKNEFKK